MRRKIIVATACQAILLGVISVSSAQILTPSAEFEKQVRPPLNLQGQIVSLRIVPSTFETKVYVTGIPADQLLRPGVGLKAFVRAEGEMVPLSTSQEGDYFVIETPALENGVKLDVNLDGQVESFNVEPAE
jgi:hypothetical protein